MYLVVLKKSFFFKIQIKSDIKFGKIKREKNEQKMGADV